MEFMTLLLITVVIVLIVQQRSIFTRKIEQLEFRIIRLQELVKEFRSAKETGIDELPASDFLNFLTK